jgi:MoxR-like ATPase
MLAGLVSGEPTILIGPPGTGKTKMVETLAESLKARYFRVQLSRTTEPDELLGPVDVVALRKGEYRRVTQGRLPDAEIVFLDEIFKASSAVRNLLLDIILNRRFLDGTTYIRIPMLALYAASNDVSTDEEDQAFWDRMLIRVFTDNTSQDAWSDLLEKGLKLEVNNLEVPETLTRNDVLELQNICNSIAVSAISNSAVRARYLQALAELKAKGLELSDRRKVKTLKVAAAVSMVYEEKEVSLDSLADALRLVAVNEKDELRKVEEVIRICGLSAYLKRVQRLQTLEAELRNALARAKETRNLNDLAILNKLISRTITELKYSPEDTRLKPYVKSLLEVLSDAKSFFEEQIKIISIED